MGEQAGRPGKSAAEDLILRTIAAHADSLLRTARRHSICADDAQDAYQRGLEIFIRHAHRLDPGRAGAWLHTVVKREAKALRRSRQRLVGSEEFDADGQEARRLPTPEEQLLSFDMVSRSAEALQRLKPQELRALWLKAQGVVRQPNPEISPVHPKTVKRFPNPGMGSEGCLIDRADLPGRSAPARREPAEVRARLARERVSLALAGR